MAHDKVYGFCENKCKVEVPAKEDLQWKKLNETSFTGSSSLNQELANISELDFSELIVVISTGVRFHIIKAELSDTPVTIMSSVQTGATLGRIANLDISLSSIVITKMVTTESDITRNMSGTATVYYR